MPAPRSAISAATEYLYVINEITFVHGRQISKDLMNHFCNDTNLKTIMKILIFALLISLVGACRSAKVQGSDPLPLCLRKQIEKLSAEPGNSPISVTQYEYKGDTVYYMKAACCDNFNIVYDKDCRVLGYPDGGFTGRGDGSLPGFFSVAKKGPVVWENKQ